MVLTMKLDSRKWPPLQVDVLRWCWVNKSQLGFSSSRLGEGRGYDARGIHGDVMATLIPARTYGRRRQRQADQGFVPLAEMFGYDGFVPRRNAVTTPCSLKIRTGTEEHHPKSAGQPRDEPQNFMRWTNVFAKEKMLFLRRGGRKPF